MVVNIDTKGTTDSLFFQEKPCLFGSPEDMFIMSLNRYDRLRLIDAPEHMEKVMEDVAQKHWGVKSTQKYCEAHELTLSGHPWFVDSGEEAIKTRILIGNLIMTFKSKGWEVAATLDVSRKLDDKTVFVFRQCPPQQQQFAVLGFHWIDQVRLIGGGEGRETLKQAVQSVLDVPGLLEEDSPFGDSHEWKLKGQPWSGQAGGDERIAVHFLTRILSKLQALGWSLAASADVSAKFYKHREQEFPLDVHSWFLLYSPESIAPSGEELQTNWVDNVNQDGTDNVEEILSERQCCTPIPKACGYCWAFILILVFSVVFMEVTRTLWGS